MLENKNIIIIGAGGLLGNAVVQGVFNSGASVLAVDIDEQALQDTFKNIKVDAQARLTIAQTDINNEQAVKDLFSKFGRIDGIVNCAYPRNKAYGTPFLDVKIDDFNNNVNVHLGSAFFLMQQAVIYFEKHQAPLSLVNLASIYGVVSPRFNVYDGTSMTMPVEYSAIKSAIIHLTKYVASYVSNSDFRVNCVSPGGLENNQPASFVEAYKQHTASKGMLDVQDVIGTILFLLSEHSKYIRGQNIVVDDGFTL